MKKNNSIHTARELLKNESFIRWRLFHSPEDKQGWEKYLSEHPEGKEEMEKAIRMFNTVRMNDYQLTPEENTKLLDNIQTRLTDKEKTKKYRIYIAISTAALFLLLLGLSQNFLRDHNNIPDQKASLAFSPDTLKKQNEILMILGNDQVLAFTEETEFKHDENGDLIILNEEQQVIQQTNSLEVPYNKLIVPKGKRSYLTLADGTRLWINSGSKVEFPPIFTGDKREIKIEGEVYLEVTENKEKPFIVTTPGYSVTVLGTAFNVSAYPDEESNFVVLTEGKVEINTATHTARIMPEQMASVTGENIHIEQVDVSAYISWKEGLLEFNSRSLSYILNRLERYYDIPVYCDETIKNRKGSGKLVLFDQIEEVLETVSNTLSFRYSINEKGVYITPR